MKCDELKAIRGGDIHDLVEFGDGSEIYHDETLYYLKNVVDAVLSEKDKEIARQNTEIKESVQTMKSQEEEIVQLKQKLEDAKATAYTESVDAGMETRKQKRALYKACANWARFAVAFFSPYTIKN